MKQSSTLFLKTVLILIAVGALAALIRFPQTEGRAANLDLISIYLNPVILYMYIASIPFFVAIYQAIRLLGFVEKNKIFSQQAVKAVEYIKYCAMSIVGFIVVAEGYLFLVERGKSDDIAGGVMGGLMVMFLAVVIATGTAVLQKVLQNAVDLKSENDLTV